MIRITPAIRLSIGLVILMISILILAQALGLTPGAEKQQFETRKRIAETLAAQVALAIQRGNESLLLELLDTSITQNPEIKSAAVRRNEGVVLVQTARHTENWRGADLQQSTPTHMRFPLIMNGQKRADFELSFAPLSSENHPLFHIPTFLVLMIFVAVSGFVGFWLYIKRILHHLDPSAVVPARVRNALNILSEGVLILDKREQIVLVNQSMLEKLNRTEHSLIGKKASSMAWQMSESKTPNDYPWLRALHTGNKQAGVRLTLDIPDDAQKIFRVNAVPILDPKGSSQGTIAVFNDVSELEEKSILLEKTIEKLAKSQIAIEAKNQELLLLATSDPLTNCLNRRALHDQLEGKFEGGRKTDNNFCCIMADIDHFKRVNDTHGHGVGDDVIKMAAESLREVVRDRDLVARMGGEEFCVILPGASLEIAHTIAERCREKIAAKVTRGVTVTCSFGVTSIRLGATSSKELIQQADEALYFSKEHGRNRVTLWAPELKFTNK
jgi:diguanylate cyclase (GGDEF)-like protein